VGAQAVRRINGTYEVTIIYLRITVDTFRDRESNFDVASSRNLAQELVQYVLIMLQDKVQWS
jgi:hypothetical protein